MDGRGRFAVSHRQSWAWNAPTVARPFFTDAISSQKWSATCLAGTILERHHSIDQGTWRPWTDTVSMSSLPPSTRNVANLPSKRNWPQAVPEDQNK